MLASTKSVDTKMLISRLFSGDKLLQSCADHDQSHITLGKQGDHVSKIQTALLILENVSVAVGELKSKTYGKSTADAILKFKSKRKIINKAYQSAPDNIVGKMTIRALDHELLIIEATFPLQPNQTRHTFS